MADILTITLNPAVDLATSVDKVVAGPKLYCRPPRIDPGGGGVNVARTIHKLGGRATALLSVGGAMGEFLLGLIAAEGVPTHPVPVHGQTRQSFAVTDEETGGQYRFTVPGEPFTPDEATRLLREIRNATPKGGFVVLSGGVTPGLPTDFPTQIQDAIAPLTDRLIVDTSKAPLERLVTHPAAPLMLLRIDQKEAAQVARRDMPTLDDSLDFAAGLVARGVAKMVVTGRGGEGSIVVTDNVRLHCPAPTVPVLSKIGAGDAFLGVMTLALAQGAAPGVALRWGVAAASATVQTEGTALCQRDAVQALFEGCATRVL